MKSKRHRYYTLAQLVSLWNGGLSQGSRRNQKVNRRLKALWYVVGGTIVLANQSVSQSIISQGSLVVALLFLAQCDARGPIPHRASPSHPIVRVPTDYSLWREFEIVLFFRTIGLMRSFDCNRTEVRITFITFKLVWFLKD